MFLPLDAFHLMVRTCKKCENQFVEVNTEYHFSCLMVNLILMRMRETIEKILGS